MIGTVLDHYQLLDVLGEGGMGVVYKALDLKLERFVAVKILHSQSIANPRFVERFKREARNQAKLTHPNIVPVYGFTEDKNMLGIVMEFIEGDTIEQLLEKRSRFSLSEAVYIMKQTLNGVAYAHEKGFIHRDLKPANVIISKDGMVRIMDFGIAKSLTEEKGITRTGAKIGTVLYMSPEQIKAEEPTTQSDIYALGLTFYEMLNGKPPFDFTTEYEIMEAHLKLELPRVSALYRELPTQVDQIILRATNKNRKKRYHSCQEFLFDLDQLTHEAAGNRQKLHREPGKKKKGSVSFKSFFIPLFLITITVVLFLYFYSAVSDLWNKKIPEEGDMNNINYSKNPAQSLPSEWTLIESPVKEDLNSLYFLDDQKGFIIGKKGVILKTTNGGSSWELVNLMTHFSLNDLIFLDDGSGIAVGDSGIVIRSIDEGITWISSGPVTSSSLFTIFASPDNNNLITAGSNGVIFRSTNLGIDWIPVNSPAGELLFSGTFIDERNAILVGMRGMLLRSSDGGATWKKYDTGHDEYFKDVFFVDKNNGYIAAAGGDILISKDAGLNWQKMNTGTISGLYSISFKNKNSGIIVSNKGEVLITNDAGKNWTITSSGRLTSLNHIAHTKSGKGFIVGSGGTILTR